MLKAKTREQLEAIHRIYQKNNYGTPDEKGISLDGYITYDQMAEIVDLLRKEDNARRKKARWEGMHAEIDGLWVAGDTIFLKGAEKDEAERFILSLGAIGYDTRVLMDEYTKTNKITI